jgi:FKBP-type peptidyl-prolyl cis-trans isomerase SlyD
VSSDGVVSNGKVVSIEYVLTDRSGNVLDRSEGDRPLVYLHGARNIVQGLEEALEGKAAGDALKVEVPPAKGYGERRKIKPMRILRSKFPETANLERGARFVMQDPQGKPFPIWVTKVQGREVHVTPEHPLAGETLFFDVTIKEMRDATDEEKKHGHAHGPGGHDHG